MSEIQTYINLVGAVVVERSRALVINGGGQGFESCSRLFLLHLENGNVKNHEIITLRPQSESINQSHVAKMNRWMRAHCQAAKSTTRERWCQEMAYTHIIRHMWVDESSRSTRDTPYNDRFWRTSWLFYGMAQREVVPLSSLCRVSHTGLQHRDGWSHFNSINWRVGDSAVRVGFKGRRRK